jgi:hypothetical protein
MRRISTFVLDLVVLQFDGVLLPGAKKKKKSMHGKRRK